MSGAVEMEFLGRRSPILEDGYEALLADQGSCVEGEYARYTNTIQRR